VTGPGDWFVSGDRLVWRGLGPGPRDLVFFERGELLRALEGKAVAFLGDSLMRQLFNRLIHSVRGVSEVRPLIPSSGLHCASMTDSFCFCAPQVVDHYYHQNAVYRFNATHDWLSIYYGFDGEPPTATPGTATVHLFFIYPDMMTPSRESILRFVSKGGVRWAAVGSGYWGGPDNFLSDVLQPFIEDLTGLDALERLALVGYPRDQRPERHEFMRNWTVDSWAGGHHHGAGRVRVGFVDMDRMWKSPRGREMIYRNTFHSQKGEGADRADVPELMTWSAY
jgi:hypothetical protein